MNGRTARDGARRDGWAVESRWEKALERGEYVTGNVVRGGEVNKFPVETEDGAVDRTAEPNSVRGDSFEHRLHVGRRSRNHAENVRSRCLLLQRLLRLVEQPHVLDRNDRLVGEGFEQFYVIVCEGPRLRMAHRDHSDDAIAVYQRQLDRAAGAPLASDFPCQRRDPRIGLRILDDEWFALVDRLR